MKSVFLYVLGVLLLSTAIALPEDIQAISLPENSSTIVYQFIDVDFGSTYNVMYINTSNTFDIFYKRENEFHVWDFRVEKAGKPETSNLRPPMLTPDETTFIFNYTLIAPDNNTTFYKVSFWMDDVKQERPTWLFPFDEYLLTRNYTVSDGQGFYYYYKFPNVDINVIFDGIANCTGTPPVLQQVTSGDNQEFTSLIKMNLPSIDLSLKGKAIQNKNEVIPALDIIQNNKRPDVSIYAYREYPGGVTKNIGELNISTCITNHTMRFGRTRSPSIVLFFMMGILLTLATLKYKDEPRRIDKVYNIYVNSSLFIVFAEFTASILPPPRPLTFTLFDAVIIWPIMLLALLHVNNLIKIKELNKVTTEILIIILAGIMVLVVAALKFITYNDVYNVAIGVLLAIFIERAIITSVEKKKLGLDMFGAIALISAILLIILFPKLPILQYELYPLKFPNIVLGALITLSLEKVIEWTIRSKESKTQE